MEIQSLSISVPAGCPNKCKFCVAKMHNEVYQNQIENNEKLQNTYEEDYLTRMAFARDNGCNRVLFTGRGEPLMNRNFMQRWATFNRLLKAPFRNIELQTSGILLNEDVLSWLRNSIRCNTLCLSIADVFSDKKNSEYMGIPDTQQYALGDLCSKIKRHDFNLRLCLNMTDAYDGINPETLYARIIALGATQVTFRLLYESHRGSEQDKWVKAHQANGDTVTSILEYVKEKGKELEELPFAKRYSVYGIGSVVDTGCMSRNENKEIQYLILREDCRLYSKWDDKGSLVF